jgi:hypothetical protein
VHAGAADASQRELTLLESNADAKAEGSSDVTTEADASVRSRLATSSAGEQGASPRGSRSASGLCISTYHKLILEVCATIKSVLMPRFLQWLATEQGHRQGGGGANGRIRTGHWEATGSTQVMRTQKRGPEHGSNCRLRIHARTVLEIALHASGLSTGVRAANSCA